MCLIAFSKIFPIFCPHFRFLRGDAKNRGGMRHGRTAIFRAIVRPSVRPIELDEAGQSGKTYFSASVHSVIVYCCSAGFSRQLCAVRVSLLGLIECGVVSTARPM